MTEDQSLALSLLKAVTNGTFHLFNLVGPLQARNRRTILTALTSSVPAGTCGITRLRSEFYKLANVNPDNCLAAQESEFIAWAKGVTK